MTDYGQNADITEEERALLLRNTPTKTIIKPDPDMEWQREQRRKKEQEQYQLELKQQQVRVEANQKRQREIDKINHEFEMKRLGYDRYGNNYPEPHQIYYDLNRKCCFGCDEDVAYISEVNKNLKPEDSLTLPYSTNAGADEYKNYRNVHICKEFDNPIISYLITENIQIKKQMAENLQTAKEYSMMGRISISR